MGPDTPSVVGGDGKDDASAAGTCIAPRSAAAMMAVLRNLLELRTIPVHRQCGERCGCWLQDILRVAEVAAPVYRQRTVTTSESRRAQCHR